MATNLPSPDQTPSPAPTPAARPLALATPSTPPELRLEVVSNPMYLSGARDLIAAVARRLTFTEHQCAQIALAVDEALCNIMRHGYDRRTDGKIWLSLWPLSSPAGPGLRLVLEDEAKQVDPATIKSRDLAEIRPGGLGVHIIKEVMDEAHYERREQRGMRLTMTKYKNSAADPSTVSSSQCSASA